MSHRPITHLGFELRAAARGLLRRPLFSGLIVVTLALGLGATTALWSVVRSVILDPLPLPAAERLAFITREGDVSIPDGVDWRAASPSFESIALFLRNWSLDLTGAGEPERLVASVAEPELFRVLALEPIAGRTLAAADNAPGAEPVVVLSEAFWRRRFAADRAVLGRTITLSDRPATVVGVMPAAADFLEDGVDLWIPVAIATPWALAERGTNNFDAVGRLASGADPESTLASARAELDAVCDRLSKQFPKTNSHKFVVPIPLLDFRVGRVRATLWLLLAAVGLLLLLACTNTGGLLLARTLARQRELGVRSALGADRSQLVAPLAAETALLVGAGGLGGLALSRAALDLLLRSAPADLPRLGRIAIDGRSVAFVLAATAACAFLAVALPALRTLRHDPSRWLEGATKGGVEGGRGRGLRLLAGVQVAIATLLLAGAGLLGASFVRLTGERLGFDPAGVVSASIVLPESRYAEKPVQTRAMRALVERAAAQPGVASAAFVVGAPLHSTGRIGHTVLVEGRVPSADEKPRGARYRPVLGDYFGTLRLPIVRGRALAATDGAGGELVAVVNERFAAQFFPGEEPIGRRIAWRYGDEPLEWMRIVGVASDVKSLGVDEPDEVAVYAPYEQRIAPWIRFGTLLVRTHGAPAAAIPALRAAVVAVDPSVPLADVATLAERHRGALAQRRFQATLVAAFAGAAIVLALQGVVALLAFLVERSRFELGLRSALGATRAELGRRVLAIGLRPAAVGAAAGLGAALASGPLYASLLWGVRPWEPGVLAAATLAVALAVAAACLPHALRASRLDPMSVLRTE